MSKSRSLGRSDQSNKGSAASAPGSQELPSLLLKLEYLDAQLTQPMYPRRAVLAATGAAAQGSPPKLLLQNCHLHLSAKVLNLTGQLVAATHPAKNKNQGGGGVESPAAVTVLLPSDFQFGHKRMMLPELWKGRVGVSGRDHILRGLSFELASLKVQVSMPQLLALRAVLDSHLLGTAASDSLKLFQDTSLLEDSFSGKMSSVVFNILGLRAQYDVADKTQTAQLSVENASVGLLAETSSPTMPLPVLSRSLPEVTAASNAAAASQSSAAASRSPAKSSPGRAAQQSHQYHHHLGKSTVAATRMDLSGQSQQGLLLSLFVQLPNGREDQTGLSLVVGHAAEMQACLDPLLFRWMLYTPAGGEGILAEGGRVRAPSKIATQVVSVRFVMFKSIW